MTTINNIADLARILQEHPDWAEVIRSLVLTREVLEFPARLAEFAEQTNRNFDLVNNRLDNLETDVSQLKSDMVEVKERTSNLEIAVNRINGRLDNGLGMNYEYKVEKNLGSIASQHMNVRRVRVLRGAHTGRTPEFSDMIDEAEDQGLITREQSEDLQRLDLVFRGQLRDANTATLVAAEISITIGDSDIYRAAERSALLAQATRMPVLPAVVGSRIDESRAALAEATGVSVLITPEA